MVKHLCSKCGKTFIRKSYLLKHINRKFPCTKYVQESILNCQCCNKPFKHKSSLSRHINVCGNTDIVDNRSVNTYIDKRAINNNNLNVDGDVKVVKFGNENLSYISDDLFKQILGRGFRAVSEFIEHSHFNKKHPENHNIYIANIRDEYIVIYDGDKWTINRRDEIMEDIIYAKSDLLYKKFKELVGQMNQSDIDRFMRFMHQRDDDQTMNRLKDEITLQLYNNRKLPQYMRKRMDKFEREVLKHINISGDNKIDKIMNMLNGLTDDKLTKMEQLLNNYL
jgi:hypothetical protein